MNTTTKDLAYLCRALKAPTLAAAVERLAERARTDDWTHEEFLAACLEREVAARQANGGELRIKAAKFPARKTLEDFDWDHQRSRKRDVIAHLGALDFIEAHDNVVFLGPPGHRQDPPRDRHLDPGLPSRPPSLVRHRRRMGRPTRPRTRPRIAPRRAPPPRPLPAPRDRRGRLHPLRSRRREPVLPTRSRPATNEPA